MLARDPKRKSWLRLGDAGIAEEILPARFALRASSSSAALRFARVGLTASTRAEVNLNLDVGGVAESVTVVGEAPLLDAASASSGRVVDNRTQAGLPVSFNNTTILARLTPGGAGRRRDTRSGSVRS